MTAARIATLIGAAAYAGILATTQPFTVSADVVTGLALAVGAGALAFQLAVGRLAAGRPAPAGEARPVVAIEAEAGGTAIPWLALLAVLVGWELYCFFGGPRPAHPTFSSVYDIVARWQAAKAVVVLLWLALGWELVR